MPLSPRVRQASLFTKDGTPPLRLLLVYRQGKKKLILDLLTAYVLGPEPDFQKRALSLLYGECPGLSPARALAECKHPGPPPLGGLVEIPAGTWKP